MIMSVNVHGVEKAWLEPKSIIGEDGKLNAWQSVMVQYCNDEGPKEVMTIFIRHKD